MFKSNSTYWNECYLCGLKGCQDCQIPFQDDKKVSDIIDKVGSTSSGSGSGSGNQLEIYLSWKKSPRDRVTLEKVFNS